MTITDDQIAALVEAAGKATPGPWKVDGRFLRTLDPSEVEMERTLVTEIDCFRLPKAQSNFEYIALANPSAILALAARVKTDGDVIAGLREALERYREALTPSGATKAAYIGEVKIDVMVGEDEDGDELWAKIPIPWTETKETMAMIAKYAAASPPVSGEPS